MTLAASLYQQIADNAQAATGATLVHFAWLDPTSREVHVGAMSGLQLAPVRRAIAGARRIVPHFDPLGLRFPVHVNQWNQRVFEQGRCVETTFEQIAAGTVPPAVLRLTIEIVGLRFNYTCPVQAANQVVGSLAFHATHTFSAGQRRTCEAFARQAGLTLDNVQLLEKQRLLMEYASDAIFVADAQGRYLDVNRRACELLAYTREELVGLGFGNVLAPADREGFPGWLQAMLAGQTLLTELSLITQNGALINVEMSSRMLPDGTLLSLVRDVRDRLRNERDRLERARLEGALLAARTAQHALNNELALVSGYTELLADDPTLPESSRALAADAVEGARRAAERVAELQQITRVVERDQGAPGGLVLDLAEALRKEA